MRSAPRPDALSNAKSREAEPAGLCARFGAGLKHEVLAKLAAADTEAATDAGCRTTGIRALGVTSDASDWMPDARWSNDVEQVKQNNHGNRYAHSPQQHCTHLILLGGNRCECFLGNLFWIAHNGAPAAW